MPSSPYYSRFLVENLIPANTLSLVSGPSNTGKSMVINQFMLRDWSQGKPIFDRKSFPVPYVYASTCLSDLSIAHRFGVEPAIPIQISAKLCFQVILEEARKVQPDVELIALDGYGIHACTLGGGTNESDNVSLSLSALHNALEKENITLIAAAGASKSRDFPRSDQDRMAGSFAYTQDVISFVFIDYGNPQSPDLRRRVTVHSKFSPVSEFNYVFAGPPGMGELTLPMASAKDVFGKWLQFDAVLFARPAGTSFNWEEACEINALCRGNDGEKEPMSERSLARHIQDLIEEGKIKKRRYNDYVINATH